MVTKIINSQDAKLFDTGDVVIGDAGTFVSALKIKFNKVTTDESAIKSGIISIKAVGAALAGLKITRAVQEDGDHVTWHTDTDFNTATADFPSTQPADIHLLGSGLMGILRFGDVRNIEEIIIQVKTSGSVRVIGNFD